MTRSQIARHTLAATCLTILFQNYAAGAIPTVRSTAVSTTERELTDHLVKLPSDTARNDLLLCIVSNDGAVQTNWADSGFIEIADADHDHVSMSVAYKRADVNDTGTVRVKTNRAERSAHVCYAITGWDGESEPKIATSKGRSSAPIFAPFVAGERNDYLFIATAAMDGQRKVTGRPASYSGADQVSSRNSGGDVALAWAHRSESQTNRELPGAGFRFSAADHWIARTIAVAALSGTSTPSTTETTTQQTTSTPSSEPDNAGTSTSTLGVSANVRSSIQSTDEADDKLQTIAYPPTIVAGDLVLCFIATDGQVSHDWRGSEFTELFDDHTAEVSMSVGYKQASGNEERTFVVSTSAAERSAHRCYAIAGWDGSTRPELTSRTGRGYTPSFNAISPRAVPSDYIYFAVAAMDGQRTVTGSPKNYIDAGFASSRNSGGDAAIAWSHKLEANSAKAQPDAGFEFSAGDRWITQAIAVKLDQLVFAQADNTTTNGSKESGSASPGESNNASPSASDGGGGFGQSGEGPQLSLTAQRASVSSGEEVRLNWSSTNATQCSASGGWQGVKTTSGSETFRGLNASQSFMLRCDSPSGSTTQSVNIKVLGEFRLAWRPPTKNTDGSNIRGLSEFRVYRGDRSGAYVEVVDVDGSASSFTMRAEVGAHYVAVSAVDLEGDESALSNEIVIVSR